MALDSNTFQLTFHPRPDSAGLLTDLKDRRGSVLYTRRRVACTTSRGGYAFELIDPLSDSLLASLSAPSLSAKRKALKLHSPDEETVLAWSGVFNFEWTFEWEGHRFDWRKELFGGYNCNVLRKPDPSVAVCLFKTAGHHRPAALQIMDYNITRFDISDRKGLELVLLLSLFTFLDMADADVGVSSPTTPAAEPAKPLPPPPPGGPREEEVVAWEEDGSNELEVRPNVPVSAHVERCLRLLETNLFITLLASSAPAVPLAIASAEASKRAWLKGPGRGEELQQYVVEPDLKGRGRINLDDGGPNKKEYQPPERITIYLSKIPLPELQSKPLPSSSLSPSTAPPRPAFSQHPTPPTATPSPGSCAGAPPSGNGNGNGSGSRVEAKASTKASALLGGLMGHLGSKGGRTGKA